MRKLKKVIPLVIGSLLFSVAFGCITTSSSVGATSIYDNNYHSIPNLTIQHDNQCPSMPATGDYATTYAKYILDENLWHPNDRNTSSDMYAARESYLAALNDDQYGTWGVSREQNYMGQGIDAISVFWTTNPNSYLYWSQGTTSAYNFSHIWIRCVHSSYWGYQYNNYFGGFSPDDHAIPDISSLQSTSRPIQNLFFYSNNPNFNYNYPSGYEGQAIVDGRADVDADGLNMAQEVAQGTSDTNEDTDDDGISDLKESIWFEDRDDIFCGVSECAYPDPLKKDVYVENDWMDDGTTAYKLNTTQIGLVADAFDNKGISLHVDTGQYGGGNELPTYISTLKVIPDLSDTDYFNLKNGDETYSANFADNRRGVWRYMISGNKHYNDDTYTNDTSTGGAYPSDDDIVVSIGRITELNPTGTNTAVAGTVMHELGHSLCLSNISYTGQDSACLFADIETYAGNDYPSSMNYDKQFSLVNYSEGLNPTGDHNDWAGVLKGMDDFVTLGEDPIEASARSVAPFSKPFLSGR